MNQLNPNEIYENLLRYQEKLSTIFQNNEKDANSNELITSIITCSESLNDEQANSIFETYSQCANIGMKNPLWIASYALTYERVQNYIPVFQIYQSAFNNQIEPPFLKDQYSKFISRMQKRLSQVVKFDLGMYNNIKYTWRAGNVIAMENGRRTDPEIDIVTILGMNKLNKTTDSFSTMKTERPAYDANLLLSTDGTSRSFVEARLADMGIDFVRLRKEKERKAQPRIPLQPISPKSESKPTETVFRLPSRTKGKSSFLAQEEGSVPERKPLQVIKSSFLTNEADPDEFNPFRQQDEEIHKEKRRPLAPISSSPTIAPPSTTRTRGILKRGDSKGSISPSRVKIQGSPHKGAKSSFNIGERVNADDLEIEVLEQIGNNSYVCSSVDGRKYFVKICQMNSLLREIDHKELFSIPEPRYETYFLVPFLNIPFSKVVSIITSKKTDQTVAFFFLMQLCRILFSLESANIHHGSIAIENIMYRIPDAELRAFDDGEEWAGCGLTLTKCDKISKGKIEEERKSALEIFLQIANGNAKKTDMPKRWNKEIWEMAISVLSLSNNTPSIKALEGKILTFLIEKGETVKSQISRINVSLLME